MAQTAHLTRATPLTGAEMQQMATLGPSFISTINIKIHLYPLYSPQLRGAAAQNITGTLQQ